MKRRRATLTTYLFRQRHLYPSAVDERVHRAVGNRVKQLQSAILDGFSVVVRSSTEIAHWHTSAGWPKESRVLIDLVLDWNSRDGVYTPREQFKADLDAAFAGSKFSVVQIPSGVVTPYGMHIAIAFSCPRQIGMDREVFDLVGRFKLATGLTFRMYYSLREVRQETYLKVATGWESYASFIARRAKEKQVTLDPSDM